MLEYMEGRALREPPLKRIETFSSDSSDPDPFPPGDSPFLLIQNTPLCWSSAAPYCTHLSLHAAPLLSSEAAHLRLGNTSQWTHGAVCLIVSSFLDAPFFAKYFLSGTLSPSSFFFFLSHPIDFFLPAPWQTCPLCSDPFFFPMPFSLQACLNIALL